MMYFCPCPCNSAIDPEVEESTFLALPRNLSYVQESYLDRHSVSARFVHNPKVDLVQQFQENRQKLGDASVAAEFEGLEEGENANLLSIVQSQEFPVCCESSSKLQRSQSFPQPRSTSTSTPIAITTSPQTRAKLQSPDGRALASPGTGSFMSRVAASRLASFLSSKEEPSPSSFLSDYDQDFSSSVDHPPLPVAAEIPQSVCDPASSPVPNPAHIHSPDRRGLKMDRGEDLVADDQMISSAVPLTSSSPSENAQVGGEDTEEVATFVMDDLHLQSHTKSMASSSNGQTTGCSLKSLSVNGKTMYPGKEEHDSIIPPPLTLTSSDKERESDKGQGRTTNFQGSPDSDAFSEEGVFVNMMDDLDTNEKSTTVSDVSDDTCVSVDSMFLSPDEEELEQEEETPKEQHKMTVEEAISRAASDLSKMSMLMYPDILDSPLPDAASSKGGGDKRRKLARTSPVRQSSDLTIHLSYENISKFSTTRQALDLPESPVYEDSEFNFNKKGLRKSSSLKTNKTPPGTPHRKKVVRFADAMGLDLESVRHVLNMESPPRIPASAMADLKQGLGEDRKDVGYRFLCPCFTQPGATDAFVSRVVQQKISLENAIITDLTITGFVRVANISYHKSVRVRYTHNGWATFHDIAASYVLNSCDGPTDRFSFSIVAPAYFVAGNRLEFALSFNAEGVEYWDNNGGKNYAFECFAKTVPTENESSWMHFL